MDEAKIFEIRQWLIKSEHDLGSAKRLITGDEPFLDTAVYHCQQAAEKAFKAYLTLKDIRFQKVHDLSILIDQCIESDTSFKKISNISDILTPYASAFRYPGDVLEPYPSDAEEAVKLAEKVLNFVLERMPEELKRT